MPLSVRYTDDGQGFLLTATGRTTGTDLIDFTRQMAASEDLVKSSSLPSSISATSQNSTFPTTTFDRNPAGVALFEAEGADRLVGRCLFPLIAPEHRASYRAMHERVCGGEPGTVEFEIVGLNGTRRRMATRAARLPESDDSGPVYVAITRDISGRKRMADRLRAIADYGIITIDESQRIVLFNTAAERIFRCSSSEANGQPVEQFIPVRFRERHAELVREFGQSAIASRIIGRTGAEIPGSLFEPPKPGRID